MLNATPLLKLYSKYRLLQLRWSDPSSTQEFELLKLLRRAAGTKFGTDHGFSSISNVAEYQKRVPLRSYEQFWNEYWKPNFPVLRDLTWPGLVDNFAVSSGTSSGATKYIPYTREVMDATTKAGMDLLCYHLAHKPKSRIFGGYNFVLTGSTDLVEQTPGIWSGDMSGICMQRMPSWARSRVYPPSGITNITSWEAMIDRFAAPSMKEDIRSLNGAPSWMLLFLDRLKQLRPESEGKLCKLYPNLELIVHGGMNFAPYRKVYMEMLEGSRAETRESYVASEAFMAVQDRGYAEGLRLVMDHGIFYEFVPLSELGSATPTRHWVRTIEAGVDYAVILSTCAGLWSYIIGDTVRFVETKPPRLLVTGRTSYMLSAVGEHLTGEEIEECLLASAAECALEIAEYSVGASFPKNSSELAGHIYVIEFKSGAPDAEAIARFSQSIDQKLQLRNEDYQAHRKNEFGLYAPKIICVSPGGFNAWMRQRGKLGGQNKVPRVINNQEIFKSLLDFACPK